VDCHCHQQESLEFWVLKEFREERRGVDHHCH
jgi:hypothetical protein